MTVCSHAIVADGNAQYVVSIVTGGMTVETTAGMIGATGATTAGMTDVTTAGMIDTIDGMTAEMTDVTDATMMITGVGNNKY